MEKMLSWDDTSCFKGQQDMVTIQRASDWWLAEMMSEGSPGQDNVRSYEKCIYSNCDGNHKRLLLKKMGVFVGWDKTGQNRSKKSARR